MYFNLDQCPTTGGPLTLRTGCCSSLNLCGFLRGICTSDDHCQGNLVCDNSRNGATNNCGNYNLEFVSRDKTYLLDPSKHPRTLANL